ncbi:hypothetical protein HPB47_027943 [Ixodes persulcatus]|uniref:Uncharacterized protein n=1 Tax=Ixodes persulcatus TaxID=34615 RepID=A0AC60PVV5_IXOPE|nr:hypothetical protein HPB47_027943 [Ixodes persulcatus]
MASDKVVGVGSEVFVETHPLPARVVHIEGNFCQIQFVDGSSAFVRLSTLVQPSGVTVSVSSLSSTVMSSVPDSDAEHTQASTSARTEERRSRSRTRTPSRSPGRKAASPRRPSPVKRRSERIRSGVSASARKKARSPSRDKSPAKRSSRSPVKRSARKSSGSSPTKKAKKAATPRRQSRSRSRTGKRSVSPADRQQGPEGSGPSEASAPGPPALTASPPHQAVATTSPPRRRRQLLSVNMTGGPETLAGSPGNRGEPRIRATIDQTHVLSYRATGEPTSSVPRTQEHVAAADTAGLAGGLSSGLTPSGQQLRETGQSSDDAVPRVHFGPLQRAGEAGYWRTSLRALFWMLLTPLLTVLLYLLCNKQRCTILQAPALPKGQGPLLRWKLFVAYALFLLGQGTLQAVPLGRVVNGFPSKLFAGHVTYKHRLNGKLL